MPRSKVRTVRLRGVGWLTALTVAALFFSVLALIAVALASPAWSAEADYATLFAGRDGCFELYDLCSKESLRLCPAAINDLAMEFPLSISVFTPKYPNEPLAGSFRNDLSCASMCLVLLHCLLTFDPVSDITELKRRGPSTPLRL